MRSQVWLWLSCYLVLAMTPLSAAADDWPSPQTREVFDVTRAHFVRVVPGESWGDVVGFAGSERGRFATAEFYARQPDLFVPVKGDTHPVKPGGAG